MNMIPTGGADLIMKKKSTKDFQIRVYTMQQIMNDQIPKRIQKAKDLLCIEN